MKNLKLNDEKTVEMDLVGEVTAQDYKKIEPDLKSYFTSRGKMKFLIDLNRLKSFSLGAAYEDIKFDLQNLRNIGATAIVGNKKTQETLADVIDKIFPEKVKYFENTSEAMKWLKPLA